MASTVKPISRELAETALDAIKVQFANYIEEGYGPKLVEAWTESGHWAICWEEGVYEWTILAVHGGHDIQFGDEVPEAQDFPSKVFAEPVNACVLGLYPQF
jgi:hypothetical protein